VIRYRLGALNQQCELLHDFVEQIGVVQLADKFGEIEVFKNLTRIFGKALNVAF
jgi:hypothetical protein